MKAELRHLDLKAGFSDNTKISWKSLLQVIYMKISCRYLKNFLSRQGNPKTTLRCFEDVLWFTYRSIKSWNNTGDNSLP